MGFGWGTRSAEDVQRDNRIRGVCFDAVAKHYENTKPIRGKRSQYNIRPLGQRNRTYERVVKVNENEYHLTYNAWGCRDDQTPPKAITYKKDGDLETLIIHTPNYYHGDGTNHQYVRYLSSPSTFYFYYYNLPENVCLANIKSEKYVQVNREEGKPFYFTLDHGDVTLTRKVGQKFWQPLQVHRQVIHRLNRKKAKELRQHIEPFMDYFRVMHPLVEAQWGGIALEKDSLFKHNDEVPEHWYELVSRYKNRCSRSNYHWNETKDTFLCTETLELEDVRKRVFNDIAKVVKPCDTVEVPLGTPCKDRYKGWY